MNTIGTLSGHTESVLCCEVLPGPPCLLGSGGEDGAFCLFDLRTHSLASKVVLEEAAGEAILSIACHPANQDVVFLASGSSVLGVDLRKAGGGEMSLSPAVFVVFQLSEDEEVNQVAVDPKGKHLAAADDAGDVTVFDLKSHQVKRTLSGHSNITSSVAFRPHRPWELFSGGLDCLMTHWDFSTGKRLQVFDMGLEALQSGNQLFNPPHVNSVAIPATDKRPFCRMVAAARGDGAIAVYDADARPPTAKPKGSRAGAAQTGGSSEAETPCGRVCLLDSSLGGHTSSAAHVTFPKWAGGAQLLSGGNDSKLILWDWQRASSSKETETLETASDEDVSAILCKADVKNKINWLATSKDQEGSIFVADVTEQISMYKVDGS